MIEFTHRITSGISFFSVVGLLVWTFAGRPCAGIWRAACRSASVAFTLVEAILGALLVKLGLTAQSQSPLRAPYLALHFTNTLLLLAALTLDGAHAQPPRRAICAATFAWSRRSAAVAAVGRAAGRGRHRLAGRAGRHAVSRQSLSAAFAQDFSATSGWLVRWRWTHPTVAFLASIFLIWLLVARRAAQGALGQSRTLRAGADSAGGAVCAGRARCDVAGAGVAAGAASAGRRRCCGRHWWCWRRG